MKVVGILALAVVVLVVVLKLRAPAPGPAKSPASVASAKAASPAATGPLWPLEVGNAWTYSETGPERPGAQDVTVAVTAEERTGFRLVEERGGKGSSTDLIEVRDDGFYFSEFESAKESTLLLPAKAPAVRDWSCKSDMRAQIARDTEFALAGATYPAFDVRYERKMKEPDGGEKWVEHMTLTFAHGLGIVRKDTTHLSAPANPAAGAKPTRYVWELTAFKPAKK